MFRRQAARAQEEPIPEDLLASIPVVDEEAPTTFVPIEEEGDVAVVVTPAPEEQATPTEEDLVPQQQQSQESGPAGAALAAQLRYDLGEAFARELDKAEAAIAGAIGDLEGRLVQAEAALVRAHEAIALEREAREQAEARLRAFKELAMK